MQSTLISKDILDSDYEKVAIVGMRLCKSPGQVYRLVMKGELRGVYQNRHWHIERASVDEYVGRVARLAGEQPPSILATA